jgi:hypothetical protein
VPECACPEVLLRRAIDFASCDLAWDGLRSDRGLAVLTFPPWRLSIDPRHRPLSGSTLPILLDGPARVRLVAVWAIPSWIRSNGATPEPIATGLERLRELLLDGPTIVAGDFNRTLVVRRPGGRLRPSPLARELTDLGFVSAYHEARRVAAGDEHEPTFFRLGRFPSPHHLDHVLLDAPSAACLRGVELRGGARWMVWSDHVPLVVELELPSGV